VSVKTFTFTSNSECVKVYIFFYFTTIRKEAITT